MIRREAGILEDTVQVVLCAAVFIIMILAGLNSGEHVEAAETGNVLDVTDFGACGYDSVSDRDAFWDALRAAHDLGGAEVRVPDGTYFIDDWVGIYSKTWLHLSDRARIVRMDGCHGKIMLSGKHDGENGSTCYWDCPHHGYGQVENVTISGGEWDGGLMEGEFAYPGGEDLSQPLISFHHASNITIFGTRIGNSDAKHFLNFDGVDGITIKDVEFHGQWRNEAFPYDVESWNGAEVVHTDFIYPEHEWSSAYPTDEDLPCRNVLVEGCTFTDCISGIGTHNCKTGLYMDGFTVKDCTFTRMQGHCINALSCTGTDISGNTASDVSQFVQIHRNKGENSIHDNDITCCRSYKEETSVDICLGTEVSVKGNTIRSAATHAVYCANRDDNSSGICSVTIEGNRIEAPGQAGIFIRDGVCASVTGNTVSDAERSGEAGISVYLDQENVSISDNRVDGFQYGLKFVNCSGVTASSNSISNASVMGVSAYRSGTVQLSGGNVAKSAIGIHADGSCVNTENVSFTENGRDTNNVNGGSVKGSAPTGKQEENRKAQEKGSSSGRKQNSGNTLKNEPAGNRSETRETASVPVYRVFNLRTGEHLYTMSRYERDVLVIRGWRSEGIGWYAPVSSGTPVYRLYNPNSGEHHYTASAYERDWLKGLGWNSEGICWYSAGADGIPIYRHYHPKQRTGNHHYTASTVESRHIVNYEGWNYEGVGWYAAKAG